MTPQRPLEERGSGAASAATAPAAVLASRMAAALVPHEPGWRLPRLTSLARRYSVSIAEIDAAIGELAARHLVRRLPDGQVYRASPAEYWVPLAGVPGLVSHVDPMGGQLACKSRTISRRRPPEDIARSLGLAPDELTVAVRCLWTVGGEPAALCATYLAERFAGTLGAPPAVTLSPAAGDGAAGSPSSVAQNPATDPRHTRQPVGEPIRSRASRGYPGPAEKTTGVCSEPPRGTFLFSWGPEAAATAQPQAVLLEMGPPPPAAARTLRMAVGEPVATVTVSFADPATQTLVATTMAMLRPHLFRVILAAPQGITAGSVKDFGQAWEHAAQDWEP